MQKHRAGVSHILGSFEIVLEIRTFPIAIPRDNLK
jgi:hypothetical protein